MKRDTKNGMSQMYWETEEDEVRSQTRQKEMPEVGEGFRRFTAERDEKQEGEEDSVTRFNASFLLKQIAKLNQYLFSFSILMKCYLEYIVL